MRGECPSCMATLDFPPTDKEIIDYFCKLENNELNYYKGVIEGLLVKDAILNKGEQK